MPDSSLQQAHGVPVSRNAEGMPTLMFDSKTTTENMLIFLVSVLLRNHAVALSLPARSPN